MPLFEVLDSGARNQKFALLVNFDPIVRVSGRANRAADGESMSTVEVKRSGSERQGAEPFALEPPLGMRDRVRAD